MKNLKTDTANGIINDEDTTVRRLIEEKEHSIMQQETLITSLKETVNIVKNKIIDQDDVISHQADVITSLRNSYNDKGGEEHDIEECKLAMQQAKSNASELAEENTELKELIKVEQQKSSELSNNLNTEILVRKKTEMAYDAQVQVVDTKDQVINCQQISIVNLNTTIVTLNH